MTRPRATFLVVPLPGAMGSLPAPLLVAGGATEGSARVVVEESDIVGRVYGAKLP